MGKKIYFSKDKARTDYDMKLLGKDNLGNNVEFYMSHCDGKKGVFEI